MKSIAKLERDIISITLKIHHEFPEISKYIGEISSNHAGKESKPVGIKKLKKYYNSLASVVLEYTKALEENSEKDDVEAFKRKGYPPYPVSEDIYNQGIQETELNPEDISKTKTPYQEEGSSNVISFEEDRTGDDLDVPGSELDDQQENVGSEDEENNYYSLGGDNHD